MTAATADALTERYAHDLATRLRAGETTSRELTAAHLARAHRTDHGAPRLADARRRAGARRGRRRRRAARRGPRRGPGGRGRAPSAARRAGRAQGPRVLRGGQCTAGSRILEGYRGAVRRARHRAAARRGRGDPGQDEHGRVRDGLVDGAQRVRADRQPVGPGAGARRVLGWLCGGRERLPRPVVDRNGHRRLDPPAGRPVRHRGPQADVRPRLALRDRRVRELARPDRAVRARRSRRRGAVPRGRGPRRARLDERAGSRSRTSCSTCPPRTTRRPRGCKGKRFGLPREYFVDGHGAGRRGARPRGGRGARGRRRDGRGGQPPAHGLRPRDVLHRRAGGGVLEPRPLRRRPLRLQRPRRRRLPRRLPRDPRRRASAPRSSAGSCSARTRCRPATTTRSTSRRRRSGR